jgi:hypothetical protein
MHAPQHVGRALTALAAAGADTEVHRELVDGLRTCTGAFLNFPLGHGMANADVHDNPYALRIIIT